MGKRTTTAEAKWTARRIVEAVSQRSYRFGSEAQLHTALAKVFEEIGIAVRHESAEGPRDRFDFRAPDGVVVEVKTKGSFSEAMRQVSRYIGRDDVTAVVLVTTRAWGHIEAGATLADGKLLHVVKLRSQAF